MNSHLFAVRYRPIARTNIRHKAVVFSVPSLVDHCIESFAKSCKEKLNLSGFPPKFIPRLADFLPVDLPISEVARIKQESYFIRRLIATEEFHDDAGEFLVKKPTLEESIKQQTEKEVSFQPRPLSQKTAKELFFQLYLQQYLETFQLPDEAVKDAEKNPAGAFSTAMRETALGSVIAACKPYVRELHIRELPSRLYPLFLCRELSSLLSLRITYGNSSIDTSIIQTSPWEATLLTIPPSLRYKMIPPDAVRTYPVLSSDDPKTQYGIKGFDVAGFTRAAATGVLPPVLSIKDSLISADDISVIVRGMAACSNLVDCPHQKSKGGIISLDISLNSLDAVSFRTVLKLSMPPHSLSVINVSACGLNSDIVPSLVQAISLSGKSKMRSIDISRNDLGDEACATIVGAFCGKGVKVRNINMNACGAGSSTILSLASFISTIERPKSLSLCSSEFDDKDIESLIFSLDKVTDMRDKTRDFIEYIPPNDWKYSVFEDIVKDKDLIIDVSRSGVSEEKETELEEALKNVSSK
ncbi:hypothetical protein ADUPG1_012886 [Aduncisulcus paluster]|uniref:Uncharacterized protein n=1 Tax=Aduncisulcus paluster TaxID=2918883 RepID=A0ABQ5K105_9EUKA|nr:hypothetical protein ADUPG1_012886 [Aduncisulcus paluster]